MNFNGRDIDHIVYCVLDFEKAISFFEKELGVPPAIGGQHLSKGTKNALINLSNKCYLEILAIDSNNAKIKSPRWMGIDLITAPQITRWALKSNDLLSDSKILSSHNPLLGEIEKGERKTTTGKTLSWGMTLPLSEPEVEIIPFMTDWSSSSVHPTDHLASECQLLDLQLSHKKPSELKNGMNELFHTEVAISTAEQSKIIATINGPKGTIKI